MTLKYPYGTLDMGSNWSMTQHDKVAINDYQQLLKDPSERATDLGSESAASQQEGHMVIKFDMFRRCPSTHAY